MGLLLLGLAGALAVAVKRAPQETRAPAVATPASVAAASEVPADPRRHQSALADTYAGAAASLRGTLVELKERKEAPELIDEVVKKIEELDRRSRVHRNQGTKPQAGP